MQKAFDWCVRLLEKLAALFGTTYETINVVIFCILWPLLTLALIIALILKW